MSLLLTHMVTDTLKLSPYLNCQHGSVHFIHGRIRKTTLLSQQASEQTGDTHLLEDMSNICHAHAGTGPDVANTCFNKHEFSR